MLFEEYQPHEQSGSAVTLPWAIGAILVTFPLLFVFMHFGKAGEGRAAWFCTAAILLSAKMRWELSGKIWFWLSIMGVVLLHIPLIFLFPWSAGWVPAFVIFPFFLVDIFAILTFIHQVEKHVGRKRA